MAANAMNPHSGTGISVGCSREFCLVSGHAHGPADPIPCEADIQARAQHVARILKFAEKSGAKTLDTLVQPGEAASTTENDGNGS